MATLPTVRPTSTLMGLASAAAAPAVNVSVSLDNAATNSSVAFLDRCEEERLAASALCALSGGGIFDHGSVSSSSSSCGDVDGSGQPPTVVKAEPSSTVKIEPPSATDDVAVDNFRDEQSPSFNQRDETDRKPKIVCQGWDAGQPTSQSAAVAVAIQRSTPVASTVLGHRPRQQSPPTMVLAITTPGKPNVPMPVSWPVAAAVMAPPRLASPQVQIKRESLSPGQLKCQWCGKQMQHERTLRQHEAMHKEARPVPCHSSTVPSCHICGRRFQDAHNLRRHLRAHTGEKPSVQQVWLVNMDNKTDFIHL
jgi:uncharacterized Zn-finger protein